MSNNTHTSAEPQQRPVTARGSALSARYFPALVAGAGMLIVSFVTRIAVTLVHGGWPAREWWPVSRAFASGTAYDVLVAQWLVLPLVVYLTLASTHWLGRRVNRAMLIGTMGVATFAMLFVAVAEAMFFAEFDGRFNFVAVDYLIYPTEIVTNIWESYPTGWIVAAIAATAMVILLPARRRMRRISAVPVPWRQRLAAFAIYAAALATTSVAIPRDLSRVSDDRALNEVASNGYYAFWKAFRGQGTRYDALYATRDEADAVSRAQRLLSDRQAPLSTFATGTTLRHVALGRPATRLNVVVVLEESFGAQLVGTLHPTSGPSLTPHFDSLAAEGTLLTNAYSTGNRTIRALEATTSSLPPLPGISVVRRPESVDLFTLPALLRARGYATEFIYGGRAVFDGMSAYMTNNGIERVVDQNDFPSGAFRNAWGVADETIFDKALSEMDSLDASGRPFYTLVLTVSNHRPYTYPAGRIAADPNARKRTNVVQYADWALGRFLRLAREHRFFDHTVFVVLGDHGPRVYGAAEIPLASYEVPVLFFAPGIVPAGARLSDVASSMDIAPTVLGLLGGEYDSKFFGRDVLALGGREGVAVMTHNNEIALLRGHRLAVLGLRGATAVYDVERGGGLRAVAAPDSAASKLVEDAIAYFETADALFRRGGYRFDRAVSVASAP
jgi:phosphoglycerol transferase MdoB-like AlkP superfamily enzyme